MLENNGSAVCEVGSGHSGPCVSFRATFPNNGSSRPWRSLHGSGHLLNSGHTDRVFRLELTFSQIMVQQPSAVCVLPGWHAVAHAAIAAGLFG